MDETFIGGKLKNMHKGKKPKGTGFGGIAGGAMAKTIVVGMLERKGHVRAEIVAERTQPTLHALVNKHIQYGATLMTDEWGGYKGTNLTHEIINHAVEYVNGQVHIQGIENFWALLKHSLGGIYISVEPFHLDRYVYEQAFRVEWKEEDLTADFDVKIVNSLVEVKCNANRFDKDARTTKRHQEFPHVNHNRIEGSKTRG